eukprot:8928407-Prorocentrum_lima.AAC.1
MNLLEWASLEGIKDNFTKEEQKEYEQTLKSEAVEKEDRRSFKECFRERKRKVREAKAKAAASSTSAKRKGRSTAAERDPLKSLKLLAMVPAGAITQEQASRMCPPGGHVWSCWRVGRWGAHLPPHPR